MHSQGCRSAEAQSAKMRLNSPSTWLGLALLALVFVAVVVLLIGPARNSGQPGPAVSPSVAPSADAAANAARTILAIADQKSMKNESAVMAGALTAANAGLHEQLFLGSSPAGSQLVNITLNATLWNELSDPDKNALFASLASVWAATWQRSHPGKTLQNGAILRLRDQSGHTLREDVFEKQN